MKVIDGNTMTVTGKTTGKNLERWTHELNFKKQDVMHPLGNPIKESGHIR
jgi:dihydroxy-acid dehydratase